MNARPLETRVLAELRALRRSSRGVSVETLAVAPTICDLLGAGDPAVAFSRLAHEVLESDLGREVRAAAASLGFLSDGDTHLRRLDDFGSEVGLEQRQVRRLSDTGLRVLAGLVSSNWTTECVPTLTAAVTSAVGHWEVHLLTRRLLSVEMRAPHIEVRIGEDRLEPETAWRESDQGRWRNAGTIAPVTIANRAEETSVVIVWRGELWPRHDVVWRGPASDVRSEALGNKSVLRLRSPGRA